MLKLEGQIFVYHVSSFSSVPIHPTSHSLQNRTQFPSSRGFYQTDEATEADRIQPRMASKENTPSNMVTRSATRRTFISSQTAPAPTTLPPIQSFTTNPWTAPQHQLHLPTTPHHPIQPPPLPRPHHPTNTTTNPPSRRSRAPPSQKTRHLRKHLLALRPCSTAAAGAGGLGGVGGEGACGEVCWDAFCWGGVFRVDLGGGLEGILDWRMY